MDGLADTTFLIGLWRRQAWAVDYAKVHSGMRLGLPRLVLGEFWHGARRAGHEAATVRAFLELGIALWDAEPVVPLYVSLCARIQEEPAYRQIGQNDLWIAACALHHQVPLVTRNRRHFGVIPGLQCEAIVE